jgi:hypothetical protein
MKTGLALSLVMLASPAAVAQPLTAPEIVKNIEGVWGWPGRAPDGRDRSCSGSPMRIWLEEDGAIYKSQSKGDDTIYASKVGYPTGDRSEANFILISYTNQKQIGLFGQAVWSLSMPDRDHFFWREVPLGLPMPRLQRCSKEANAQVG